MTDGQPHVEFDAGAIVLLHGTPFVYHGRHDGKLLLLAKVGERAVHLTDGQVFELAHRGDLIELEAEEVGAPLEKVVANHEKHFASFDADEQERARLKDEFVQLIRAAPRGSRSRKPGQALIDAYARAKGLKKSPDIRTVQVWAKKDREAKGNPCALVRAAAEHRERKKRLPGEVQELLEELREEYWLNAEKYTKGSIHSMLDDELRQRREQRPHDAAWLRTPHRSTTARWMDAGDPVNAAAHRHGREAADAHHRIKEPGRVYRRPLEAVYIDSTQLDVFIVDEHDRVPKRPWLTIVMDAYTRMVIGLHISLELRGWTTTMRALCNAMSPKETYLRQKFPHLPLDWPCKGRMAKIIVDRGSENYNMAMWAAMKLIKVQLEYTPAGKPWYKGVVERMFRTLNMGIVHKWPGACPPDHQRDNDKTRKAMNAARLTLQEVERDIHEWLLCVYHGRRHRRLGMSPRKAWIQGCERFPVRPAPPADALRVLLAKDGDAYVHHYGVEWKNQIYKDKGRQLGAWIPLRKPSVKVKIKYDPADLSTIWVLDEENLRFIRAEAENQAYTRGLSEKQHQHERALALQQYGGDDQEKLNMVEAQLARRYHETSAEKGRTFKIAPPREREDYFAAYEDRPNTEATDLNSFTPHHDSRDSLASGTLPASAYARAEPSLAARGAQADQRSHRAPGPNDDDRRVHPSLESAALETRDEPVASPIRDAERLDIEERIRRHKMGLQTYQEIPPTSPLANTAVNPSQSE